MLDTRPSFESIFMELAYKMAERGTCVRLKVGCVITSVDFRYIYGIGYNGNASGLKNGCDSTTPGNCGCLHAEENAIINCTVPRETEKIIFTTHLPCSYCAKRILNLGGVKKVYYSEDYRIKDGLNILQAVGVEHSRLVIPAKVSS